ncbi:MAG: amino acid adenylation domain-containing protein, partial [Bacteroidota bacterium]
LCVQWMNAHFQEAFDITQAPLFSFTLLKAGAEYYYWLLKMHHLTIDGWGYWVLTNKVVAYYNELSGKPLDKLPVTYSYRDYVQDEQTYNSSAQFEKDKAYWLSKFESLPPLIREPQFVRSVKDQLLPVSSKKWIIPRSEYAQLENLAKAQNVSVFQLWLGILAVYFYRSTGQERLCIGIPVLNRSSKAHKNTIGLFTGISPLLIDLNDQLTFSELLAQIRNTLRQDYRHQRFPIQELLRSLNHLTLGERSLFQLSFSYELSDMRLSLGDTTEQVNLLTGDQNKTPFDLRLRDFANGGDVDLDFYFLAAYFEEAEFALIIERLKAIVQDVLIAADQAVSRINILPEAERVLLLHDFNDTTAVYPDINTVVQLFEAQAALTPDQIALISGETTLTYRELNEKANQLAHYLRNTHQIQANDVVALQIERSASTIIGILGVLKSGAAYLPISTDFPPARVRYMLANSRAKTLLTDEVSHVSALEFKTELPDLSVERLDEILTLDLPAHNPARINAGPDLAYVLYTSGSTGQPKGVSMPQRSLVNLIQWQNANCHLGLGDRTAQFVPYTFDVSFQEIFATLSSGGTLIVLPQDIQQQFTELPHFIAKHRINRLFLPFVGLQQLAEIVKDAPTQLADLKEIITAGEQLQSSAAIRHLLSSLPGCVLKNQYGPTEAHVVSEYVLGSDPTAWPDLPPIGKPIANVELHILDAYFQPTPIGIPGELLIGGIALADGYLNNADLTAEKFIPHPFKTGERLYKTGDLARWLPDGNIEYLGRIDQQLKIRGYRIETGEIEQVLLSHEAVQTCAVVGLEFSGVKELAAYLVPKPETSLPDATILRSFLGNTLPDYMIPS